MPKLPRWIVLLLLTAIVAVRMETIRRFESELRKDPDAYREIAEDLQRWDNFGYRSNEAYRPPLYPVVLSLVAPDNTGDWSLPVGTFHLAVGLLTVLTTYLLARRWKLAKPLSFFSALLVGLDPLLLRASAQVMTETLATFLATIALLGLTFRDERNDCVWRSSLAGALLAICVLCRPTFLVWAACVFGHSAMQAIRKREAADLPIGWLLGFLLVISPWAVRNYLILDRPILTTTHGGYTFYRANNPLYYQHLRSTTWGTTWDTLQFDTEWERQSHFITGANWKSEEIARDRFAYQLAWKAIGDEPWMFVRASLLRVSRLWGMVPWQVDPNESSRGRWLRYSVGVFYFCEFALAIVGVWTLGKKLLQPPWVWGSLLVLSFTIVHTFYWTDMRMRAPLVPVIALVAAVGAGRVWGWIRPASAIAAPNEARGMQPPGLA